ncbi:NAD-dependent epimerase/dehydratase family protein [Cellulomonas sp. URHD0024]|uniref:NAD-dependent epimerase/dehydratase family protein n=1 Tax=Cellulomonas sp. URHD0024 TaxID=1302620 RepID=UPI00041E8ADF|nr:NAD-dependent epimerase/dehydratase family protein [Cellulomonas sp. URHD0024]
MFVLLTGATGYIGSNVLAALLAAGHEVLAVTRSETAAAQVREAGAKAVVHDLTDTAWLVEELGTVDAAIHTAATGDSQNPAFDDAVIDAVVAAFSGTEKRYLHTSGIWIWGAGDVTEDAPLDPPAIVAWRPEREERLLAADVRATIVAPAIVHGQDRGVVAAVFGAGSRTQDGAMRLVGSGAQHWSTVHVEDLADLYVAALSGGPHGRVAAASGHSPTVREIAQAVVGAGGTVVPESDDDSRARFGDPFADALLVDQRADGALARATWGWVPRRPTLLDELSA